MKLGPVTKFGNENKMMSEKLTVSSSQEIVMSL